MASPRRRTLRVRLSLSLPVSGHSRAGFVHVARSYRRALIALIVAFVCVGGTANAASVLNGGESMPTNSGLTSPNGKYVLWLGADGNLVIYDTSGTSWVAKWSTGSFGGTRVYMQRDGNFVVYDANMVAKWNSGTAGFSGGTASIAIQNDGNLVISRDGLAVWNPGGFLGDTLVSGATMKSGAIRRSRNGRYQLQMQGDGNLVMYDTSTASWTAKWNSGASTADRAVMQTDGNLVAYDASTVAKWNAGTAGFAGADLRVQDDGNLTIVHRALPIWSNGSYIGDQVQANQTMKPGDIRRSRGGRYQLQMQGDGNLVAYDTSTSPWSARWWSGTSGSDLRLQMQGDGHAVIYDSANNAKWYTGTNGNPGARFEIQGNGHATVMQGDTALWVDYRTSWQYGEGDGSVNTNDEADRVIASIRSRSDADAAGFSAAMYPSDRSFVRERAVARFWSSVNWGGNNYKLDRQDEAQTFAAVYAMTPQTGQPGMVAGLDPADQAFIAEYIAEDAPEPASTEAELREWLGAEDGTPPNVATRAGIEPFTTKGDMPHLSSSAKPLMRINVHAGWLAGGPKGAKAKAKVTVVLQQHWGGWKTVKRTPHADVRPGWGSNEWVATYQDCTVYPGKTYSYRAVIDVDVNGYIDDPSKLYTRIGYSDCSVLGESR